MIYSLAIMRLEINAEWEQLDPEKQVRLTFNIVIMKMMFEVTAFILFEVE